jgi:hypothetical protein
MPRIIDHRSAIIERHRGGALLAVLFIVMAVTVISLGILARSDAELASGQNMALRVAMDQLAASGLEHARGLALNPQGTASEYWTGQTRLQLDEDSDDYYDVTMDRGESGCDYIIRCKAYRKRGQDEVGCSRLSATLRLDPAIALWTGAATTLTSGLTIHGDVYCGGALVNKGAGYGDAFAADAITGAFLGQTSSSVTDKLIQWPFGEATATSIVDSYQAYYSWQSLASETCSSDLGVAGTTGLFCREGDLVLDGGITVHGMLLVNGNLTVGGSGVALKAAKDMPALYVTGDLKIDAVDGLTIEGLAVVDGDLRMNAGASGVRVIGGLFSKGGIVETVGSALASDYARVYGTPQWDPAGGSIGGALRFDGVDDYIDVQNESPFDMTGAITVAAWIKVAAFDREYQAIVTKGDSAWRLQRWSNTNRIEFACTGLTHNPPHGSLAGNVNVNDGQWRHVAGVYDGTRIYLYVDGNLDVSEATSGFIAPNDQPVMIGRNAQVANRLWNGWIDDVRIYNRGLSETEVRSIMSGGSTSGLASHWRLDGPGADVTVSADPAKAAIVVGPDGNRKYWSPAGGAFFKTIEREQPY